GELREECARVESLLEGSAVEVFGGRDPGDPPASEVLVQGWAGARVTTLGRASPLDRNRRTFTLVSYHGFQYSCGRRVACGAAWSRTSGAGREDCNVDRTGAVAAEPPAWPWPNGSAHDPGGVPTWPPVPPGGRRRGVGSRAEGHVAGSWLPG